MRYQSASIVPRRTRRSMPPAYLPVRTPRRPTGLTKPQPQSSAASKLRCSSASRLSFLSERVLATSRSATGSFAELGALGTHCRLTPGKWRRQNANRRHVKLLLGRVQAIYQSNRFSRVAPAKTPSFFQPAGFSAKLMFRHQLLGQGGTCWPAAARSISAWRSNAIFLADRAVER